MTVFEDTTELWQNALEHDTVATVDGPASIETLLEARDRFVAQDNEPRDGTLVISLEMAREIPRGWVEIDGPALPDGYEEFRPFGGKMVTASAGDGDHAMIVRSDAVRLDMEILEPTGVIAIDFGQGDSDD